MLGDRAVVGLMVWSFQYEPRGSSYPDCRIVEGYDGTLQLEDDSRDGGTGLIAGSQGSSGRRVRPETVPKAIQTLSRQPLQDFEAQVVKTVSPRLRALIEELEPGVHQFEPVDYTAKDGSALGTRWFWQICNRLDSVHRERTSWVFSGYQWVPPPLWDKKTHLMFDLSKIGKCKFWHDKHVTNVNYCSDDAKKRLDAEQVSGFRYSFREQA